MMSDLTSKNKALVRRVYEEMWNQNRDSVAIEIFDQPAGVQRFMSEFLSAFPDLQHTIHDLISEGDRVAVRFSAEGTHTGRWMDFAPTGISIQYTGVTLARITENKIIEHHTWWDKASLLEQVRRGGN